MEKNNNERRGECVPPEDGSMLPRGSGVWAKGAVAVVFVDFILSLPSWAVGVILVVALAGSYAFQRLWAIGREDDDRRAPRR